MNDSLSLAKQKQILAMRDKLVNAATQPAEKLHAEQVAFNMLREASDAKLIPALVQRNNADFVAAFLIGKISESAWRFLITGEKWQILRAKASAIVLEIPVPLHGLFTEAACVQGAAMAAVAKLKLALDNFKKGDHARAQIQHGQAGFVPEQPGTRQGRAQALKRGACEPRREKTKIREKIRVARRNN